MAPPQSETNEIEISEVGEGPDYGSEQDWGWEEAVKRLEKLRISDGVEIEISEEQIADNDRRQEDEVISITDDVLFI
jgi:hypothetical protein